MYHDVDMKAGNLTGDREAGQDYTQEGSCLTSARSHAELKAAQTRQPGPAEGISMKERLYCTDYWRRD